MVLDLSGEAGDTAGLEEEAGSTGQVPGSKQPTPAGNMTEMWQGPGKPAKAGSQGKATGGPTGQGEGAPHTGCPRELGLGERTQEGGNQRMRTVASFPNLPPLALVGICVMRVVCACVVYVCMRGGVEKQEGEEDGKEEGDG